MTGSIVRTLTDKPITEEIVTDAEGNVIAAHLSTVVTNPAASNAVIVPDALEFPAANATRLAALNVQTANDPSTEFDVDTASVNEVQTLAKTGTVSSGTFTLTFNGHTTSNIAYNADAATVKAALVALPDFVSSDLTVGGGPLPTAVTITFTGAYAGEDVALITADSTNLVGGGTHDVTETTKGVRSDR